MWCDCKKATGVQIIISIIESCGTIGQYMSRQLAFHILFKRDNRYFILLLLLITLYYRTRK